MALATFVLNSQGFDLPPSADDRLRSTLVAPVHLVGAQRELSQAMGRAFLFHGEMLTVHVNHPPV
jgi:hypothetical protein